MENCAKIWKNCCFSGGLRPDWGNTTRTAMAGLGSIGLIVLQYNESYQAATLGIFGTGPRASGLLKSTGPTCFLLAHPILIIQPQHISNEKKDRVLKSGILAKFLIPDVNCGHISFELEYLVSYSPDVLKI